MAAVETERRVPEERPLAELIGQLSQDVSQLVRQEVELAKREAGEKLRGFWAGASSAAVGGVICHVGALALTAGLILLLAQAVSGWLAALIVGVVYSAIGAVLLRRGTTRLHELRLAPEQTTASLRDDVEAIKEAVR